MCYLLYIFHEGVNEDLVRGVHDLVEIPWNFFPVYQFFVEQKTIFSLELFEQGENVVLAESPGVGHLQRHEEHANVHFGTVIQEIGNDVEILLKINTIQGLITIFKKSDDLISNESRVSVLEKSFELVPVKFEVSYLFLIFVFAHALEEVLHLGVVGEAELPMHCRL